MHFAEVGGLLLTLYHIVGDRESRYGTQIERIIVGRVYWAALLVVFSFLGNLEIVLV